ncbi:hypothetical protein AVEN_261284-1, partial [Araneus ventricosus]
HGLGTCLRHSPSPADGMERERLLQAPLERARGVPRPLLQPLSLPHRHLRVEEAMPLLPHHPPVFLSGHQPLPHGVDHQSARLHHGKLGICFPQSERLKI